MADMSLVPVIVDTAKELSGTISNFITKTKATGVVERARLEYLGIEIAGALEKIKAYQAEESAHNYSSIVRRNIREIASTRTFIDELVRDGSLHDESLDMALNELELLRKKLDNNLERYSSRI